MVIALQLYAVLLWGLHLYVRTLPSTTTAIPGPKSAEAAWWGLWPATYAPAWTVWVGTAALGGLIGWWWLRGRYLTLDGGAAGLVADASRLPLRYYGLAGTLLAAFFAFPIVHTRWGDAYMLANGIAWPDPALRLTHSWQAPLDVLLHSRLWLILGEPRGWTDATPVYRLLSPLAGALYLGVVLALAADRRLAPAWVTFGLLSTLGLLQLFFGYIENYSFAAAGVLAYLLLGVGVIRGRRPLWSAPTVLALTNATHPSTIVLAPSLLYLGWQVRNGHPAAQARPSWTSVVLQIGLPTVLIAGATALIMEAGDHGIAALLTSDRPGGGDARWLVPLFTPQTRWEQYTMFSWLHLRDFLNQQLLVAPVTLPALIILATAALIGRRRSEEMQRLKIEDRVAPSTIDHFLLIAAAFYLLFTWLWNPDYGGQRDWDLFSLAALPLTLLLIVRLLRALGRGAALLGAAAPLIFVQTLHTAAWIYQNTLPWQWP